MKEHNFRQQKYQKSDFYQNKKLFKIDDIDAYKILVSRKEPYGTDQLNISLDMIMMTSLDLYIKTFLK